jgi:signal transduction histidine kinase
MNDAAGEARLAGLLSRARIGMTESLDDMALRTLDGRPRWADLRVTQVPARVGEAVGDGGMPMFLCVINDRTVWVEGQRAREAAARAEFERDVALAANRAKTQLLSRVSHELRTPLNAVLGFSQLLRMPPHQLSPQDEARVGHILAAGQHLLTLVDDILEINEAEHGQLSLHPEPLALGDLARSVLDLQMLHIEARGLSWRFEQAPGHGDAVLADAKRTREVLDNLVSNAIKYNRDGGWIALRLFDGPQGLCLEVSDGGIGLTPEQVAHLFEPFNRLGADRTAVQGHGLGLSITKALVQAMGGTLQVSSVVDVGSRFVLTLPRAPHAVAPS